MEFQLRKIEGTDAGKALLGNMTKNTERNDPLAWIRIEQYPSDHINPLVCNAEADAIGGTYRDKLRHYRAQVRFEPEQFHKGSYCYAKKGMDDPKKNGGKLADEVLFHELTHAHRFALRMKNYDEVRGGLAKYTSPEEFLAVVITNIYISDVTNTNSSGLRGSHQTGAPLEAELRDSIAFYAASADVYPIISKFANEEWPLFNAMADVRATFNPLRALKEHEDWVREASQSQEARNRDIVGEVARKTQQERMEAEKVLYQLGFVPGYGKPVPNVKDLASSVLSPLAKTAIAVLKR